MSAEFVDTNILVYAHDGGAGAKHDQSVEPLARLFEDGAGVLEHPGTGRVLRNRDQEAFYEE